MGLIDRRRALMSGGSESEDQLYSIGTDVITKYIGRNVSGVGLFNRGTYSTKTGEITISASGGYGTSDIFIPVDPTYSYQKNAQGRIYFLGFYDEDYNFISSRAYNNLNIVDLPAFPENTKYIRIATHSNTNNWKIAIIRTA